METIWHAQETRSSEKAKERWYLESESFLEPIDYDNDRVSKAWHVHAFYDQTAEYIWTAGGAYQFILWRDPQHKTLWTYPGTSPENIILSADKKIPIKDIDYSHYCVEQHDTLISVRIVMKNGTSHLIANQENKAPTFNRNYDIMDLEVDASWAHFLATELGAWLGVFVKESRNGLFYKSLVSMRQLLPDNYLADHCRSAGTILRNQFRVISVINETLLHKDFDFYFDAKKYANGIVHGDTGLYPISSIVYNDKFKAIYCGK